MHKLINDRPDLYKRENRRVKFDLLVCRLVQFSETDVDVDNATLENLQDLSEQWFVASADVEPNSSCLCSQGDVDGEEVKYVTYIKNRFTGYVARVGSTCIEKFGDDNPIQKEVKLLFSLMKRHSVRVNPTLAESMVKQNIITQLELALIKELGQKRKLEQDAIDTLSVLKAKIAIEKIPPSVADIAEWIENFIRNNPDNRELNSPYDNKNFTISERLIDEYRELRRRLLIADAYSYEKQKAVRVLSAFYSDQLDITPEPKKERPNIEQCQLDEIQVNRCSADELIHAAQLKVENYISSKNRNITEEKETYTVLSVLLDAYQRFSKVTYNIDLLDGIQERIARFELEIEKSPSAIKASISKVEEALKAKLYQNIYEIEHDIKQKQSTLQQEFQQVREELSCEAKSTIADSRKLLDEVKTQLVKLQEDNNNLVTQYTLNIQQIENDIWSTINSKNNQIVLLKEAIETSRINVDNLRKNIALLEKTVEVKQANIDNLSGKVDKLARELKSNSENSKAQFQAVAEFINEFSTCTKAMKDKQAQAEKNFTTIFWIVIVLLSLGSMSFWTLDNRLHKIEIEGQQRLNPTIREIP
ncbi:hypothetical protein H6F90_08075 [Trichocoleus sp. FACHB-591]|uniref:hypothetical protein n=1 Tax=Trichocoleus sp. FACHB-591 TaxID=2692872 RepID=UPI001682F2C3|nr:hypothetical protein [Trichocoleus sp. FACHB-591]MBD2095110.1 hypothetical protein [Trichocoleus sp. FACHB-591]